MQQPKTSRTTHSVRNVRTALTFYMVGLLCSFAYNSVFLRYLGAELLGLNTIVTSLIGFLNVAELGLSSAIAFSLYAPLARHDQQEVSQIISIQLWFYRGVAIFVGLSSLALLPFFPYIFSKTTLPLYFAYAIFGVLLINTLAGYLFTFRQVILSSDQREDQVTKAKQGARIGKQICQMLAIIYLPHPFLWWLALELLWTLIHTLWVTQIIRKLYPWLRSSAKIGGRLRHHYPEISRKMWQVVYHKAAGFALNYSPNIVIYQISSTLGAMTQVTLYQNYMVLLMGLQGVFYAVYNSLTATVGNLILEGNALKVEQVFRKIFVTRIWVSAIIVFAFVQYSHGFMRLWLGQDLSFSSTELYLFALYIFLILTRLPDQFIAAYGIFQDIYAPIIESLLNIGLSLLLGYLWGLKGVLIGINISLLCVVVGWKLYYLYHHGFGLSMKGLIEITILTGFFLGIGLLIAPHLDIFSYDSLSWKHWAIEATIGTAIYSIVSGGLAYLSPIFRQGIGLLWEQLLLKRHR